MAKENEIEGTLAAREIKLPESVKILLYLQVEFNIQDTNVNTILTSLKIDDEESKKKEIIIS